MAKTVPFYRDTLGLPVRVMEADSSGGYTPSTWLMCDIGDTSLIFFQGDPKPGKSPVIVFSLDDGGIDAVIESLARKGVPIVTPVSEAPGGWTGDFLDPDGHILSCYQTNKVPR